MGWFTARYEIKPLQDKAISKLAKGFFARLTFDHVVNDLLQDMIDGHFKFYKHVNDDPDFAKTLLDLLFEGYYRGRTSRSTIIHVFIS